MGGAFGPPPGSRRYPPELVAAIGWGCALFFALCGAAAVRMIFDRREQVRIGPSGIGSARWRHGTIPWVEIGDVTIWVHRGQRVIVLHLRDPSRYPERGARAVLASANKALTGGDLTLSMVGTDRSFDEAMAAIVRFRPSVA